MAKKRISFKLESDTKGNTDFRHVIFTGKYMQLVLMSLKPKEDIPMEIHQDTDQFFRVEKGRAIIKIGKLGDQDGMKIQLVPGDAIIIPAGTYHQVFNKSEKTSLKLYTIYAPPKHPANTLQKVKPKE